MTDNERVAAPSHRQEEISVPVRQMCGCTSEDYCGEHSPSPVSYSLGWVDGRHVVMVTISTGIRVRSTFLTRSERDAFLRVIVADGAECQHSHATEVPGKVPCLVCGAYVSEVVR